ncbi:hypothetical protein PCH_Pc16g03930 [Penicillium rubens Wisconsin 54-1255]|uniref:Uncharacterized protein n=1 Tax=Penicillium rubens (strain ATCC 28089 / DSM 1075 / NRRL 1951 / Wisconsin 54-1255) TaxID=500485 RepID=B6H802_PENRW|nr:hypothetical protein PCH_Pc16g03930 [Penicillium rubens Wisconsin 54-1255]
MPWCLGDPLAGVVRVYPRRSCEGSDTRCTKEGARLSSPLVKKGSWELAEPECRYIRWREWDKLWGLGSANLLLLKHMLTVYEDGAWIAVMPMSHGRKEGGSKGYNAERLMETSRCTVECEMILNSCGS